MFFPEVARSYLQGDTLRTPPLANGNFAKFEKEEGELSPNVYFDKADLAVYSDHNGSNAKAKHSMEIDADTDDEDSENVLEGPPHHDFSLMDILLGKSTSYILDTWYSLGKIFYIGGDDNNSRTSITIPKTRQILLSQQPDGRDEIDLLLTQTWVVRREVWVMMLPGGEIAMFCVGQDLSNQMDATRLTCYDRDDDDGDSFEDDADDGDEDEEEYLASVDAAVVVPTVEPVSLPEGIDPVIPSPSTDITTTGARITIRLQASIFLPPKVEVERLLAMPIPPPSPHTSLSPPSVGERLARCMVLYVHSSPPLIPSLSLPSSGCPTQIQTLRITSTQALIDAVTTALPSPPLSPPLYIQPPVNRRDDILETELPPHKKLCLFALGPKYEVGESSTPTPTRAIGESTVGNGCSSPGSTCSSSSGIYSGGTWVDPAEAIPEVAPMTLGEVNTRTRISQQVTMDSQRVDLLMEDRIAHQETILIMEEEAYASREA
nr:paired amphipathic helix protein Sin3-like 2 isoform X1 [Tanacetum cinerariifolium]